MSTGDFTWQSLRSSGFTAYNGHNLSGVYYPSDANINYSQAEFALFSTYVPARYVDPIASQRAVYIGPQSQMELIAWSEADSLGGGEGGGTVLAYGQQPNPVLVYTVTWPTTSTAQGVLTHEWGHAVDIQYRFTLGNPPYGLSSAATIQAAWTRVQSLMGGGTMYGWTNVREFWAELFRFHFVGKGGANSIMNAWTDGLHPSLTADAMFRVLISGPPAYLGPDDSFATAMHAFIAGLTPPPTPVVVPQ